MNVVVHRPRHPQLATYIHSATSGLLPFIQKVSPFSFSFFLLFSFSVIFSGLGVFLLHILCMSKSNAHNVFVRVFYTCLP